MNGLLNQQPESFFHLWIYQSTSDRNAWYALTVRGTNPWTLKRYEAGMCIGLFWSLYNANRFHVAVDLFSDRSQRTSKCGKRHQRLVCHLSFFYHILTSSVIYHWTDARQHGIYLLNWILTRVRGFLVALLYLVSGFSLCSSLSWELRENGVVKNLQFCP